MQRSNELGYNYPGVYLIVSKLIEAIIHSERDPAMSSPATQQPTPQLFFQTVNSYQRTQALKAALELKVSTAIGEQLCRSGDRQAMPNVRTRHAHPLRLLVHHGVSCERRRALQ